MRTNALERLVAADGPLEVLTSCCDSDQVGKWTCESVKPGDAAAAEVHDVGARERSLAGPDAADIRSPRSRALGPSKRRIHRADDAVLRIICRRPLATSWRDMIDHVGVNVSNFETASASTERRSRPGFGCRPMDFPQFGSRVRFEESRFWVRRDPRGGAHVAFRCADRTAGDEFHRAALAAGGKDNGSAGIREHYHPTYYAAFVLDPDGNNIEAVCHRPPT
jgi:catechol 2,3-dioxygenase-like lactoylglutathione lyase family enzyme